MNSGPTRPTQIKLMITDGTNRADRLRNGIMRGIYPVERPATITHRECSKNRRITSSKSKRSNSAKFVTMKENSWQIQDWQIWSVGGCIGCSLMRLPQWRVKTPSEVLLLSSAPLTLTIPSYLSMYVFLKAAIIITPIYTHAHRNKSISSEFRSYSVRGVCSIQISDWDIRPIKCHDGTVVVLREKDDETKNRFIRCYTLWVA